MKKKIIINQFQSNNYIEYKSKGDRKTLKKIFKKIKKKLKNI